METVTLAQAPTVSSIDGFDLRPLVSAETASMAHLRLPSSSISGACHHGAFDELWYVMTGTAQLWMRTCGRQRIHHLREGSSIHIPPDTDFQLSVEFGAAFTAITITVPQFSPDLVTATDGPWERTV